MSTSFHVVPGDPGSRVIIHVPHASRAIPADVRAGIMLDDLALGRELDEMTDAFTDVIAARAADRSTVRPWLFVNDTSRLVVDPERFPDEREELNAVGRGAVYERTSDGFVLRDIDEKGRQELMSRFFTPYADAFTRLVDERLGADGAVTIIDLHSYPRHAHSYELHADGPRPEVCIGTDAFHTPEWLRSLATETFSRCAPSADVDLDTPFAGCYVPLKHYGTETRVRAVMVEIRRDLYLCDGRLEDAGATPLVYALSELIDGSSRTGGGEA